MVMSYFTLRLSEAYSKVPERPARPKPSHKGPVQRIDKGGTSCQIRLIHRAEASSLPSSYGSNARQALDKVSRTLHEALRLLGRA
jgi:hypothetical protein